MAGATQKPKLGNVTVATVKRREQARQISARLEAAGVKCFLNDERGAPLGAMKARLGGINVQVDRSDVVRALQLLQQKDDLLIAIPRKDRFLGNRFQFQPRLGSWVGTAIQIMVILALAAFMAWAVFY
jgi:hypothetical protein